MRLIALLIGLTALSSLAGEMVSNEMFCDDTREITRALKTDYNEVPIIYGMADDDVNSIMTIWVNPQDESWTIVATKDSISCVIGYGQKLKVINFNRKKI